MRSGLYSYVDLRDANKLEDPRTETILDLLKDSDPRVAGFISKSRPLGMIRLVAVIPEATFGIQNADPMWREVTIDEVPIYDLSPIERLICIGVGRYAENHLRPRCPLGQDSHMGVSREHGVAYVKDGILTYRDIGTFRKGSTNGTTVNGGETFFNSVIPWQAGDYLGIGAMVSKVWGLRGIEGNVYRLRFIPEGAFRSLQPTRLI